MKRYSLWCAAGILAGSLLLLGGCGGPKIVNAGSDQGNIPQETAKVGGKPTTADKVGTTNQAENLKKLKITDIRKGSGAQAKGGQRVVVSYTIKLKDGTVAEKKNHFQFDVGIAKAISGMDYGVRGMRVGGVRSLVIPPELGYGNLVQGKIPANSTLYCTVTLRSCGKSPVNVNATFSH